MTPVDDWPALAELCDRYGVSRDYWDWQGNHVPVQVSTAQALLGALDVDASTEASVQDALAAYDLAPWRRMVAPVTVGRAGHTVDVVAHVAHGQPLEVQVVTEDGAVVAARQVEHHVEPREVDGVLTGEARFVLPDDLPTGYHTVRAASDGVTEEGLLVLAPDRLELPSALGRQAWGLMTQLYSVRSRESWGIGDFGDLATLSSWGGGLGAEFVLVNPLHAAEPVPPVEDSPYLPTSRRYLNPLYVRVTDVPELAGLSTTDRDRVDALREDAVDDADGLLDRQASYAAKLAALDLLHDVARSAERQAAYEAFLADQGPELRRFATWCALAEDLHGEEWPASLRDPASAEVAAAAERLATSTRSPSRRNRARSSPGAQSTAAWPTCSTAFSRPHGRSGWPTGSTSSAGCSGSPTSSWRTPTGRRSTQA